MDARTLLRLHEQRTLTGLRDLVVEVLERALDGASAAVLVDDSGADDWSVELACGPACPLRRSSRARHDLWQDPGLRRYPLSFRGLPIGEVQVLDPAAPEGRAWLAHFLEHYAAALAKLKLDQASAAVIDHYLAGLQAFEQGVVLFQETSRDVTAARFLQLATNLLRAKHAALLTFARVGSPDSVLQLDQVLGVPDALLEQMRDGDGGSWPARWLEEPPTVHHRGGATFPRWQDCEVGTAVRNVVTCPLRYLGIAAGVALFFNVEADDQGLPLKLSTLRGLGELGAALLHRMQLENEALFARHLETQLEIAATIQARLLPVAPPGNRRWQCAWSSRPSQSIGGDYLDLFDGPHDTILAMIADVSGHGIDSALLAASTRAHYRALAPHTRPGPALAQLNRELYREVGATGMFVTGVAVQLAADGRQARLASAGHNPVLLLRTERRELIEVGASGPPLGFAADTAYDDAVVTLAAGDVIVLYSDGITEATDGTGEMFGEERLGDALRACAGDAAHAILTEILAAVDRFTGRRGNLSDDASIAVVKVAG